MDTLDMIGKLAPAGAQRDAIHIAVIPQQAKESMEAGARVRAENGNWLGVVDPYLTAGVDEGDWYWLFLRPATIQSLRHVWTPSAFAEEGPAQTASSEAVAAAGAWLTKKVNAMNGLELEDLLAAVEYAITKQPDGYGGDGAICFGKDFHDYSHVANAEFWSFWSAYTGRPVPDIAPNAYFRCAC